MSIDNVTYYNILAPTKIDVSRFQGGQIYDIVSDDQAWINIWDDTGVLLINGKPFHIKADNGTHILTKIEFLSWEFVLNNEL